MAGHRDLGSNFRSSHEEAVRLTPHGMGNVPLRVRPGFIRGRSVSRDAFHTTCFLFLSTWQVRKDVFFCCSSTRTLPYALGPRSRGSSIVNAAGESAAKPPNTTTAVPWKTSLNSEGQTSPGPMRSWQTLSTCVIDESAGTLFGLPIAPVAATPAAAPRSQPCSLRAVHGRLFRTGRTMKICHPCVNRNPEFSDEFERAMASDLVYHLGRDEPTWWKPVLPRVWQCVAGGARPARNARHSVDAQGTPRADALPTAAPPRTNEKKSHEFHCRRRSNDRDRQLGGGVCFGSWGVRRYYLCEPPGLLPRKGELPARSDGAPCRSRPGRSDRRSR